MKRRIPFLIAAASLMMCSCAHFSKSSPLAGVNLNRLDLLNELRDEINSQYGFRDGVPRVNLGPCGRVARDFRAAWNARFAQTVNIAFVMSPDNSQCYHVLVKLPDGQFFDGGNGLLSQRDLISHYNDGHIDEMKHFDFKLLDARSYGLGRSYPVCPNYSDEL